MIMWNSIYSICSILKKDEVSYAGNYDLIERTKTLQCLRHSSGT